MFLLASGSFVVSLAAGEHHTPVAHGLTPECQ